MTAHFTGVPVVELLDDGRRVKLVQPFGFVDEAALDWPVPAGTVVDGASIPRALWALIGGPFEGKYRDASIVHDHYCDLRSRAWEAVHRVFHDAMIVSGVGPDQAKLLYFAVYRFGPRWEQQLVRATATEAATLRTVDVAPPPYDAADLDAARAAIAADASVADLERLAGSLNPAS